MLSAGMRYVEWTPWQSRWCASMGWACAFEALGVGPVEMFASSGGAVTALALVAAYPNDLTTLVAHEPPLFPVLPDAEAAERARAGVRDAYEAKGSGAGMAAFIAMSSWQGEFNDDFFARPAPDP